MPLFFFPDFPLYYDEPSPGEKLHHGALDGEESRWEGM
jgi:hypothetical protein